MSQRSKKKAIENTSYGSSEELYQALFEQAADGIFIADQQGSYVEVNQHGCEMLGYTREEILNLSLQDLIPAEDLTRDPLQIDDLRAGKPLLNERYLCCKDGRLLPVEISAQMLTDGRFLGIVRDITERKQAEEALQKSHEELQVFFSQTIDGCFFMMLDEPVRWDETTDKEKVLDYVFAHQHITKINDAMLVQYNATREQMLNLTPSDFFQHNLTHGRDLWRQLFDVGKIRMESDERKLDGTPMWIEGEYILLHDSKGRITGHFGIQRDITERKQLEEDLRHSHEVALQFSKQLAVLQEVTIQLSQAESADDLCRQAVQLARLRLGFDRVGIWFIEEHRGIMRGSFGTDERGELRDERSAQIEFRHEGLAWRVFSHKESMALVEHRPLRDHLGQEVGEGDHAMAALWDGDEVIGVVSVDNLITRRPIRERQLEILRLYATTLGHLITRKWAGEQLRESNERFRLLAESSLTGIYLIQDGLFRYVNPALAHVFGYKVEEVADKLGPMDLVYLDDRLLVAENIRRRVEGEEEAIRYDFRGLRKDGSVIYIEVHGRRIEHGGKTGVIGTLVDITERKQAEAERQSHLWFLESMDRINQSMQGTNDIEQMMINVLDTMLSLFECDRAWLVYPCVPEAATWQVSMERTHPEYPGVIPVGIELSLDPVGAAVFQILRATNGPVKFGPEVEHQVPVEMAQGFSVQSFIAMALYPKVGQPWSFGLHQCSYPRAWTPEEERLFQEIGRRLADSLTSLLAYRNLRQSERRLAEAQHMAHVGWWDRDYEADNIALSDEACRIFGLPLAEHHQDDLTRWHKRWQELIHPEDKPGAAQAAEEALQGGPRYDVEYRIVRPNGEVRFIRSQGNVIWDESGQLRRMFGTMQDITELRQAEDELRASEARFRTFVDHATDSFFLHAVDGTVLDVNRQACESLGYSREELIGMTPYDFDVGTDRSFIDQINARLDAGEVIAFDTQHRRKDGTVFPVEVRVRPFWEGKRRFAVSLTRDITERRRAEETLRESEERLRQIASSLREVVWLRDDQTRQVLYVNPAFQELTGWTCESFYENRDIVVDAIHPDDKEEVIKRLDQRESIPFDKEHRIIHLDGSVRWVSSRSFPVRNEAGEVYRWASIMEDITERKQAEEALRASEARFRMLVEQATDAFFLGDEQGRILDVNRQTCESLGYTREELIGMTSENYDANPNPTFLEKVRVRLATGEAITFDTIHRRKDGTMFPVEVRARWFWQDGRRFGLALARDVTERKQAQEALTLFRTLIDHTKDAIEVIDPETGRFLDANEQACQALGYTREEFLAFTVLEINPLITERSWQNTMDELRRSGSLVRESQHRHKDGSIFPVEVNANYVRLDRDYVLAVVRDITERKQADEALRASEERYRALYRDNPSMFFTLDSEGIIISVNAFGASQLGYTIDELEGRSVLKVFHEEDQTTLTVQLQRCVQNPGQINQWLFRKVRKDGSLLWVEEFARAVTAPNGALNVLVVCQDITDRKQAEESLLQREAQLQHIIDTVPEGVMLLDANGRIHLTNPVAEQYLAVLAPNRQNNGRITHLGERLLPELLTSPPKGLWHEITSDALVFEAIARPVENNSQNGGWVLVLRDITQERDIQRQVKRQERLAAVGQLAAGIAHDFNNILAVINLYAQFISRTVALPTRARERLHTIEQQTQRAADLIQQILDFSRQSILARRPLDLLPFLEKLVALLERTLPEHIQVELAYAAEAYFIQADPSRMQQVLMNLAVNARDAMPEGGSLQIRLAHVQNKKAKPMPIQDLPPGHWVRIAVADSGGGISPESLAHIFEPFFTTKEVGEGTGLGLAQVYGIVQQHEGYIDVTTEVSQGTTFFLYFPTLETGENAVDMPDRSVLQLGQGQKVLVVEDDLATREALLDSLTLMNYETLAASNGREALAILATTANEIELVLSDAVMPEMGGIALFHTIKEQYPTIPVILLTGHPLSKEMESLQTLGLAGWLPKPPDLTGLGNLLAKALTV